MFDLSTNLLAAFSDYFGWTQLILLLCVIVIIVAYVMYRKKQV